mmetsp:Transcript_13301/g.27017  ORF Transcript_13301/g.27017 Transcript_13301/m.27017 type:complete len:532 (+) Transcript_13301:500-2095(+)
MARREADFIVNSTAAISDEDDDETSSVDIVTSRSLGRHAMGPKVSASMRGRLGRPARVGRSRDIVSSEESRENPSVGPHVELKMPDLSSDSEEIPAESEGRQGRGPRESHPHSRKSTKPVSSFSGRWKNLLIAALVCAIIAQWLYLTSSSSTSSENEHWGDISTRDEVGLRETLTGEEIGMVDDSQKDGIAESIRKAQTYEDDEKSVMIPRHADNDNRQGKRDEFPGDASGRSSTGRKETVEGRDPQSEPIRSLNKNRLGATMRFESDDRAGRGDPLRYSRDLGPDQSTGSGLNRGRLTSSHHIDDQAGSVDGLAIAEHPDSSDFSSSLDTQSENVGGLRVKPSKDKALSVGSSISMKHLDTARDQMTLDHVRREAVYHEPQSPQLPNSVSSITHENEQDQTQMPAEALLDSSALEQSDTQDRVGSKEGIRSEEQTDGSKLAHSGRMFDTSTRIRRQEQLERNMRSSTIPSKESREEARDVSGKSLARNIHSGLTKPLTTKRIPLHSLNPVGNGPSEENSGPKIRTRLHAE